MVKKLGCASFFQPTSQCLEIWWNTFPRVCYITSYLISLSDSKFTLFWFTWHNHQKLLIKCLFLSRQFFCFFSNKEFFSLDQENPSESLHRQLQHPKASPCYRDRWSYNARKQTHLSDDIAGFFLSCHVEALRDETKSDRDGERFVD